MDVSNCPVQFTVGKGSTWQARHSIKVGGHVEGVWRVCGGDGR